MNETLLLVSALFVLSSPLPWLLVRPAWTNRDRPGAVGILVIIPSVSLYTLSSGVRVVTTTDWVWYVSTNLVLLAIASVTVGWFLTTTEYTGYLERPHRALGVFGVFLLGDQLFAWTNTIHHEYYDPVSTLSLPQAGITPNGGLVFQAHAVGTYLLVFAGIVVCLSNAVNSRGIRRKQTLALLGGVFPPTAVNLLWQTDLLPWNLTPVAFVLSVFVLAWVLFEADFLDVVPRGRERAVRNIDDPIVIVDNSGRVVESNPAARDLVSVESDWRGMQATDFFAPFSEQFEQFKSVTAVETEISVLRDRHRRHFNLSISPLGEDSEDSSGRVVLLRDITQVKQREHTLQQLQTETEKILGKKDRQAICTATVEAAEKVVGTPHASAYLYNRREEALVPVATSAGFDGLFEDNAGSHGPDSRLWELYRSGDITEISGTEEIEHLFQTAETPVECVLIVPLGSHGLLALPAVELPGFDDTALYFGRLLSATVETALDRARRERGLETVQSVARDAMTATTYEGMATRVLEQVPTALDLPLSAIWEFDPTGPKLQPVGSTGPADPIFDTVPVFEPGNSIAWRAYDEGETKLVSRTINHPKAYNPDSPIGSEVLSPIGEFGVFAAGSTQPESFTEDEQQILETLTTNLQTAALLIDRRRDLRLLDQVLGRILRHNLRNKLSIIQANAEQISELGNPETDEFATEILWATDKLQETSEHAQTMRKVINEREETVQIPLEPLARRVVQELGEEFPEATVQIEHEADPTVVAHPSLEVAVRQLVRNAIEHHTGSATVTVRVFDGSDGPTVEVADDGPGIPAYELKIIEEHGESALEHGSGVGLWLVDRVASYSNAAVEFTVDDGTVARLVFSQ